MRYSPIEKGTMVINGHEMKWEMARSEKKSAFGIQGSRIHELNIFRDGTMVADFNKKWLKIPMAEDEEANLCLSYLVERFGNEKKVKQKGDKEHE